VATAEHRDPGEHRRRHRGRDERELLDAGEAERELIQVEWWRRGGWPHDRVAAQGFGDPAHL
jgi:hypothetical protein